MGLPASYWAIRARKTSARAWLLCCAANCRALGGCQRFGKTPRFGIGSGQCIGHPAAPTPSCACRLRRPRGQRSLWLLLRQVWFPPEDSSPNTGLEVSSDHGFPSSWPSVTSDSYSSVWPPCTWPSTCRDSDRRSEATWKSDSDMATSQPIDIGHKTIRKWMAFCFGFRLDRFAMPVRRCCRQA